MKYTHLTEEFLMVAGACVQGIVFARNNGLIGFPFDKLNKVRGEYEDFICWARFEAKNIHYSRRGTSLVITGRHNDIHWDLSNPLRLVRKVEDSITSRVYHLETNTKRLLKKEIYEGNDLVLVETLEYSSSGQLTQVQTFKTVHGSPVTNLLRIGYDSSGRLSSYARSRIDAGQPASLYVVDYSYDRGWFGTVKITENSSNYQKPKVLKSKYYDNGQLKRMGTLRIPQF